MAIPLPVSILHGEAILEGISYPNSGKRRIGAVFWSGSPLPVRDPRQAGSGDYTSSVCFVQGGQLGGDFPTQFQTQAIFSKAVDFRYIIS